MSDVVIIGAGNLGKRHLASLLSISELLKCIYVVDKKDTAMSELNSFLNSEKIEWNDEKLRFVSTVKDLPKKIFLVVVATPSTVRFDVLNSLREKDVKYILLEKVLFQDLRHYYKANEVVAALGSRVWVNCPRRMMDHFKELASFFPDPSTTNIKVYGSNWGLACNSIHMIDFGATISKTPKYKVVEEQINPVIVNSKRSGFVEFMGDFKIEFDTGTVMTIDCQEAGSTNLFIELSSPEFTAKICSITGQYQILDNSGIVFRDEIRPLILQSELTKEVFNNLRKSGACDLTELNESIQLHLPFFKFLLEKYNYITNKKNNNILPIT